MPPITSPEVTAKAKAAYKRIGTYKGAAREAGVSPDTIKRIVRREGLQKTSTKRGRAYPLQVREEAIKTYALTGSIEDAAIEHNISRETISGWIKSEWGNELLATLREQNKEKLDAGFTELIQAAKNAALDRIVNGEDSNKQDEDGNWIKKAVSASAAATVMGITYDKQRLLREQATVIHQDNGERLANLAEQFRSIAKSTKPADNAIDITPVDNSVDNS